MKMIYLVRAFLAIFCIIGILSLGYVAIAAIGFAGMLDNGGTGDMLEWLKNPVLSGTIIISIIVLAFAKKSRRRLARLLGE